MSSSALIPWRAAFYHLVLILVSSSEEGDWHSQGENDVTKVLSFDETSKFAERFSSSGVTSFTSIGFDSANYQVIVGARDYLFRLSLEGLQLLQSSEWSSNKETIATCTMKGQSASACHNYIRVLHIQGRKLFVCGTNSFRPLCTWRKISDIESIDASQEGITLSPFGPAYSVTSVMTSEGSLFAGTFADFAGLDPAITRAFGPLEWLRTEQYHPKWLSSPTFIESFETDNYVYFVFREDALESINCGAKKISSRIGRVCKNDRGGDILLKGRWITYLKASLNCLRPGDYPFYFDEVQSVAFLPREQLFYATFSTSENGLMASAICVYNMSSVDATYTGPFKLQFPPSASNFGVKNGVKHYSCEGGRNSKQAIQNAAEHQLMDAAVQPHSFFPVFQIKDTNSLYIGTESELIRLPVAVCSNYRSQLACLEAKDPYCGWNTKRLECTTSPDRNPLSPHWLQGVIDCTKTNIAAEGGWGAWSNWHTCFQKDSVDACLCRTRQCDSPVPSNGGKECMGSSIEVTNCTVHGGWTFWSAWSQCSATCGIAIKTRKRSCTNPEPKFGGRVCVGQEKMEIYCHSLPPCPIYTQLPVNGGWNSWSSWNDCSSSCGTGLQRRVRICNNPTPLYGGLECSGCSEQLQECENWSCQKTKLSIWSQWVPEAGKEDSSLIQRRYRLECSAAVLNLEDIRIGPLMHENRRCSKEGVCSMPFTEESDESGWLEWSKWSQCDSPCNGGYQQRQRKCRRGTCIGSSSEKRLCNNEPCRGEWTCWSDWSPCSVSCGSGIRQRSRDCVAPHDRMLHVFGCDGNSIWSETCENPSCNEEDGWGPWSEWSSCSETTEERIRQRRCQSETPSTCRGLDIQRESCVQVKQENIVMREGTVKTQTLVLACLVCFVAGATVGALCVYTFCITSHHEIHVPISSHCVQSKPNHYVSVPPNEWKGNEDKEGPLESTLKKNGIKSGIRSVIAACPLKDLDTATIKRSSHGSYRNGHLRADYDSDTIF